ncbi:MAG TPA: glycosyltransferase family 39 protein, partial [Galbitalea sp.]
APIVVGMLGFAISAIGSWMPSVWYDEAATITSATRSWAELWAEVQQVDAVHATYYALMHVVFQVFGYSPLTLRLPSAIAVGLAAATIVVLVRCLGHPRIGVIAGVVFCLVPRVTWMGGEGRSYASSALLAVVLTLVLVRAMRRPGRLWWPLYGALVAISCFVFAYLALIVVAHACTMLARYLRSGRTTRVSGRRWLLATVSAVLVLVPFGLLVHGQSSQLSWIAPIGAQTVHQVVVTQWFAGTGWMSAVEWLLLICGSILLVRRWRSSQLAAVILPALILPTIALALVSVSYLPVYSPRYLAMCTPFVAIVMAAAIDRLRPRPLIVATIGIIAVLALPHLVLVQRAPEAKEHSSWSQVAALISRERAQQDASATTAIIYDPLRYHPTATTRTIEYAYPDAFAGTVDVTLRTPAAQIGELWETRDALDGSLGRLDDATVAYLVTSVKQDTRPATEATFRAAGWHVADAWSFTDVNVVEYSRD